MKELSLGPRSVSVPLCNKVKPGILQRVYSLPAMMSPFVQLGSPMPTDSVVKNLNSRPRPTVSKEDSMDTYHCFNELLMKSADDEAVPHDQSGVDEEYQRLRTASLTIVHLPGLHSERVHDILGEVEQFKTSHESTRRKMLRCTSLITEIRNAIKLRKIMKVGLDCIDIELQHNSVLQLELLDQVIKDETRLSRHITQMQTSQSELQTIIASA
jgi:hypothetical protein